MARRDRRCACRSPGAPPAILAQRLRRENIPTGQIVTVLIERFALTSLATYRHAHGLSQAVLTDLLSELPIRHTGPHTENVDTEPMVTLRAGIGEGTLTLELTRRDFTALIASGGLAALLPASLALLVAAETGPVGRSWCL